MQSNYLTVQDYTLERVKKEEERHEQQKLRQKEMTPLCDALFASLNVVKNILQCTFNPLDCKFYEATFQDSNLTANFKAYFDKAAAYGLDVTELDNAMKQLNALCLPSGQSIAELDTYIQDNIIDSVRSFQYYEIELRDKKGLHPLLFNQPVLNDVNICSENMSSTLSLKDYGLFASTAVGFEEATAFLRLLASAVDAEPESYKQVDETRLASIAILERHPKLLFRKGVASDHLDRKICATPYQLFLGTGDIWALKQVHEAILPKIEDGEAQAEAQFKEQFPLCQQQPFDSSKGEEQLYDDRNKAQIAQTIAQLQVIIAKITADPCTNGLATLEETRRAVTELRQIFAPKENEVIRTGLHFPLLAIMKEIFKVYDTQFNPWSSGQLFFFSREVIGTALRALTAVDGQCCKKGLGRLDMEKGPDRRDGLFCQHPKGIPVELAPISDKLGRTMFVDPYDGESCFLTSIPGSFSWYDKNGRTRSAVPWAGAMGVCENLFLKTYGEQKQKHMGVIMRSREIINTLSRST